MSNKPVIESLKRVLADSYTLYLKTQNYHWNVTGPTFRSLHLLFEEQYKDLAAAIDEIAERIRSSGEHAPGSFKAFGKLAAIKEAGDEQIEASIMVNELAKDQDTIIAGITKAMEAAQKAGEEATADMLIGRLGIHEKNRWMLKSSI
jgi:starvation-inducible DNA-binding protein